MSNNEIYLWGTDDNDDDAKGFTDLIISHFSVDTEVLKRNFSEFMCKIDACFADLDSAVKNFEMDEIDLNLSVSGSGEISLIGSVKTEVQGGITVKMKRKKDNA